MTDPDTQSRVLATLRGEIAREQKAADAETDPVVRKRRREHVGIRAEVAEEEAAAIAAEISESNQTALPLHWSTACWPRQCTTAKRPCSRLSTSRRSPGAYTASHA